MTIPSGPAGEPEVRKQLMPRIEALWGDLAALALSTRHRFSALQKSQVPETPGAYTIYEEETQYILYVGQTDNLRFRIMENHLCKRGESTFVKSVQQHRGFATRSEACDHIRKQCSVAWLEIGDARKLMLLEHFAIAVMQPSLNRG